MDLEEYIAKMKEININILTFIDDNDNIEENHSNLLNNIKNGTILNDKYNMKAFLYLINKITSNHYRTDNFFFKIEKILQSIKKEITEFFSSWELFMFFRKNKRILLYLFDNKFIIIDQNIYEEMQNYTDYLTFFTFEISYYIQEKKIQINKKMSPEEKKFNDLKHSIFKEGFQKVHQKRRNGENEFFVPLLIQKDEVDKFSNLFTKNKYKLDVYIEKSINETNPFLLKQENISLIEYSAFFGSFKIFKYLLNHNVTIKPSIWIYAIHGNNIRIIHLLEKSDKKPENYEDCLIESIKCHNSKFIDYFIKKYGKTKINIMEYAMKYYNFIYIPKDISNVDLLFYACKYDYYVIVNFLIQTKKININHKIYNFTPIYIAGSRNNQDIINLLFSTKKLEIFENCFYGCKKLSEITIPDYLTSIGINAFSNCFSLTKVTIPSSITKIENYAFRECSSLEQVIFKEPSSLKTIGTEVFSGCKSLIKIALPSSLTSIGNGAFKCTSLTQIKIPSSVTKIEANTFSECSSLTQVTIPSSITSIEKAAFSKCQQLTQIAIPSSVTEIGNEVFAECIRLLQITIPSSVVSIGNYIFSKCKSLKKIEIPSSVIEIGKGAFSECVWLSNISISSPITEIRSNVFFKCFSLLQINIPPSVTSIGSFAFVNCTDMKEITIPPSVTSIGDLAFRECTSLTEITIPSSVTIIGDSAFFGCSSLKQITILSPETEFGDFVFFGCSSLAKIVIPSSFDIERFEINSNIQILRI